MKGFIAGLFTLLTMLALNTQAALIQLIPSSTNLTLGDAVQVDVRISDLGAANSLGTYDLDINYDASLLGLTNIHWGDNLLGNQLDLMGFGSWQESSETTAGTRNLFELSFDDAAWLNSHQASEFTLFSLVFTALAQGGTTISAQLNALGDAWGNTLPAVAVNGVGLSIDTATPLPEPSSLLLLLGLLAVIGLRSRAPKHY